MIFKLRCRDDSWKQLYKPNLKFNENWSKNGSKIITFFLETPKTYPLLGIEALDALT